MSGDDARPIIRLGEQTAAAIATRLVEIGWTQADLARELGLTQKHISQMMTGTPRLLDLIAWGMGARWEVRLVPVMIEGHDLMSELREADDER